VDADRNGAVSAAEIEASLKKAMERRRDRILADLDTNKDGAISRAELDASVDRMIAAADADRDGGVTLEEAKSYRLAKLRKPATPTGEQAN
jgi:Ca2+-binding EF-hand superfamily protein